MAAFERPRSTSVKLVAGALAGAAVTVGAPPQIPIVRAAGAVSAQSEQAQSEQALVDYYSAQVMSISEELRVAGTPALIRVEHGSNVDPQSTWINVEAQDLSGRFAGHVIHTSDGALLTLVDINTLDYSSFLYSVDSATGEPTYVGLAPPEYEDHLSVALINVEEEAQSQVKAEGPSLVEAEGQSLAATLPASCLVYADKPYLNDGLTVNARVVSWSIVANCTRPVSISVVNNIDRLNSNGYYSVSTKTESRSYVYAHAVKNVYLCRGDTERWYRTRTKGIVNGISQIQYSSGSRLKCG